MKISNFILFKRNSLYMESNNEYFPITRKFIMESHPLTWVLVCLISVFVLLLGISFADLSSASFFTVMKPMILFGIVTFIVGFIVGVVWSNIMD